VVEHQRSRQLIEVGGEEQGKQRLIWRGLGVEGCKLCTKRQGGYKGRSCERRGVMRPHLL